MGHAPDKAGRDMASPQSTKHATKLTTETCGLCSLFRFRRIVHLRPLTAYIRLHVYSGECNTYLETYTWLHLDSRRSGDILAGNPKCTFRGEPEPQLQIYITIISACVPPCTVNLAPSCPRDEPATAVLGHASQDAPARPSLLNCFTPMKPLKPQRI